MKNFNVKQSGSEVILEEVNPYDKSIIHKGFDSDNPEYYAFKPLILTSIDPNIKPGDLIREDQLEPDLWQYKPTKSDNWYLPHNKFHLEVFISNGCETRQVAKLKQPVHETPKSVHDLETCTETDFIKPEYIGKVLMADGRWQDETPIQEEEAELKPTRDYLKSLGFKELPHFTVMNSVVIDLGRRRMLSIGCLGEPNEMMFISEMDAKNPKKMTDLVCLHNWDYDGFLTKGKIESALRLFGIPVQEHKPESEDNVIDGIFSHVIKQGKNNPFVQASKIVDDYVNDCCMDVPRRIGMDIMAKLYESGFEITKKK